MYFNSEKEEVIFQKSFFLSFLIPANIHGLMFFHRPSECVKIEKSMFIFFF